MVGANGMYYETVGNNNNRSWLLLLHGMMSSTMHWTLNRERLSQAHNLILVDLPGHGKSGPLKNDGDWHPDAMVARLDDIRAALGPARWHLCGQSFGAGITLRYALTHPDRVIAQAFTNSRTSFRDETDPKEAELRAVRVARIRTNGHDALRQEHFHPRFARRFPPELRDAMSKATEVMDLETYVTLIERAVPASSLRGRDADPKVPTLLINGRHERNFQPYRDALEQAWPSLEIRDIDGGHSVNIENPETFDRVLLDFLARQEAAGQQP